MKTNLLIPANHAIPIVPPDEDDDRQAKAHRRFKFLRIHHEACVTRHGHHLTFRIEKLCGDGTR